MMQQVTLVQLVVILCMQLGGLSSFTVTETSGASGPTCALTPQCLGHNAVCHGDMCHCTEPTCEGLGYFLCHKPNETFGAVLNDPFIYGFDGSKYAMPLVCKFKMTEIKTRLCVHEPSFTLLPKEDGHCVAELYVWGGRRKGKTFVNGIDARFHIVYNHQDYHQFTRITATANDGVYKFKESTNQEPFGLVPDRPAANLSIPDLGDIVTIYDTLDNFARIIAPMCGIQIGIRGVDHTLPPLDTAAGAYILLQLHCAPIFLHTESSLISPPEGKGQTILEYAEELAELTGKEVSPETALFHKMLMGSVPQDFPFAAVEQLMLMKESAEFCSTEKLIPAIEKCKFILDHAKFLKCYDHTKNLQDALSLMERCLYALCDENGSCKEVVGLIKDRGCEHSLDKDEKASSIFAVCAHLNG